MKVLSYNIRDGGGRRLPRIARLIRQADPDVVALLEATSRVAALLLARRLGMRLVYGPANNPFNVAWLSRPPILRSTNHRLPQLAKTLLEIEVAWDGAPLRLFATHLAAGDDTIHPSQEMPVILDVLRPLANVPHLLVGDLNSLSPDDRIGPPPFDIERMQQAVDADPRQAIRDIQAAGYVDCYRAMHPQLPGYTYPADNAWLRIDYIFAPPALASRLINAGMIDGAAAVAASDHFPVWAEFS